MVRKKYLTGWVVLLTLMIVSGVGSLSVLAESGVVTDPMQLEQSIEVELNDNFFNPEEITLPSGATTTLILKNNGKLEHTFTVEELGIDVVIQPGKEESITVQPKKPGTYKLICRFHLRQGMIGRVLVE